MIMSSVAEWDCREVEVDQNEKFNVQVEAGLQ